MPVEYDRSFAPYVMPKGLPREAATMPDARWFAKMALGQARSAVGNGMVRLKAALPDVLHEGPVGRGIDNVRERLVPAALGRLPTTGDAEFAYQRFAGMNPLVISRVRELGEIPQALQLCDELWGQVMGGGNTFTMRVNRPPTGGAASRELNQRILRGDVFIARYDALRVASESDLQPGKFIAPATALFCYAPEMDTPFPVVPLAIECAVGRPEGERAVFTPISEQRWRSAKQLVGVADINLSELCLHLARAHYMTVPFAIALQRKLPPSHPLHIFMLPHLRFNLFVDRMAWVQGVKHDGGILVRSLGGRARWSQDVARTVYYNHSFREQHFERDLIARGLSDHAVDYPYRDDGRLLWKAIRRFVEGYVRQAYPDNRSVAEDSALQAFVADVTHPEGGNVRGLLAGERLDTQEELTEILTQIIFVAGPLHSLAHYGSAAQLQDVHENPSFLTGNPLSAIGDTAPGPVKAMHQYTRVVSTNCKHDTFGDFSRHALGRDPRAQALITAFQRELEEIEGTIRARNVQRLAPFIHFLPSRVSNGITV